jgi:RimJ/RimL family protein N-acetyltransferase
MSDSVRLRPVAEADLPDLERRWAEDSDTVGEYNWTGWSNPRWRSNWEEDRLLGDKPVLLIDVGGTVAGFVDWHRIETGGRGSFCWEFGIVLWPGERGKGYGTQAQRLLAEYLFANSAVNRIQAWTEAGNLAEQRSLEKAGFTRESVLRGYSFRGGAWRDVVYYGMLREELATS